MHRRACLVLVLVFVLGLVATLGCGSPDDEADAVPVTSPREITDDHMRRFVALWKEWQSAPEVRRADPDAQEEPPSGLFEKHGLARADFLHVSGYMTHLALHGANWSQEARRQGIERRIAARQQEAARSTGEVRTGLEQLARELEQERADLLQEPPMSALDKQNFETAARWVPAFLGLGPPSETEPE